MRGRPKLFVGKVEAKIVKVLAKSGITGGQIILAEQGIKISRPTLGKIAKANDITLTRGRPALAA